MFRNYCKIAIRNLFTNKVSTAINIGGLAVGMAVAVLIGLWIYDELSFNHYHKNHESIGQIWAGGKDQDAPDIDGSVALQFPLGAAIKNNYGHYFDHVLMAWWFGENTLTLGNDKFTRMGEFIEPGVIDMLSLKMIKGNNQSLKDLHSIIISQTTAEAIFGKADPINKSLKINNQMDVTVTGVYEDIPKNNNFGEIKFFAPWDLFVAENKWVQENADNWGNRSFNIYVQTKPNISLNAANAGIKDIFRKVLPKDFLKEVEKYSPFIQAVPMDTWHLYSEFKNGKPAEGRITFVWLFGIIGIFVLILACINFMNLSTARSEKRGREVGIRKAIGSLRGQLVLQFLSESFVVVLLGFILAIVLVSLSITWFNDLADKDLRMPYSNPVFWLAGICFVLFTGFLAGLYPAFYLSSFKPVKVLKGTIRVGRFASVPRKVLVVIQFTVSVVLIIGTIIVYQQIQYARNRPIGYSRDGLLTLSMNDPNFQGKQTLFKTELVNTGMVEDVAYSNSPVTQVRSNSGGYTWKGRDPQKDNDFAVMRISQTYGNTVNWKLVAGRDFSTEYGTDSNAVIINETAAKYMGLKNPVGEILGDEDGPTKVTIIGVVKDVLMDSPFEPVKQSIFFWEPKETAEILIKIKPTVSASEAVDKIGKVFGNIIPTASFDYKFVDAEYASKFSQEQRVGKLAGVFAVLAVIISCLGLFGLSAFIAEQRTKEIGIRKVLGATVLNLWQMLSKDFVVLVFIACIIAAPIAWYFMNQWLSKYTYRTNISWWVYAAAGGGAFAITLLTVSYQAIKAAIMNPVKSLRSE